MTDNDDLPFASEPAEKAFQAARKSDPTITRGVVRIILQIFQIELDRGTRLTTEMLNEQEDATKKAAKKLWFPRSKKPKKPGVYYTATACNCHLGCGRNRWDGEHWWPHKDWGSVHSADNLVWQGTGKRRTDPITGDE